MGRKSKPPALPAKLKAIADAALDKKAEGVVSLDVKNVSGYTDAFVICSGSHPRQNQAIADNILRKLKDIGDPAIAAEGLEPGNWVLIDAGDVIIHVFDEASRQHYNLEQLWNEAPRVYYGDAPPAKAVK